MQLLLDKRSISCENFFMLIFLVCAIRCSSVSAFLFKTRSSRNFRMYMANEDQMTWRVLVLHGKQSNGSSFRQVLKPLEENLNRKSACQWKWTYLTAPYKMKDGKEAYEWWTLKPGERSFTATEYGGYEASSKMVMEELPKHDFCLGHSQGAILLTSLLQDSHNAQSLSLPTLRGGYILNGAAWPNPFTKQLENLNESTSKANNFDQHGIIVVGTNDKINPPDGAFRVRDLLKNIGIHMDTVKHDGGHSVPVKDEIALESIVSWLLERTNQEKLSRRSPN